MSYIYSLNQNGWGVCAFVAGLQAAVVNKKVGLPKGTDHEILYPRVKKFVEDHPELEAEMKNFTEVFGDQFKRNSLQEMVYEMSKDKNMQRQDLGIAGTAKVMCEICKDLGLKSNFIGTTSANNELKFDYKNTIYGIGKSNQSTFPKNYRSGLLHWVYVDPNGTLVTWGRTREIAELKSIGYNKVTHYLNLSA